MPVHDWTRVSSRTFHNFHQRWVIAISDSLNPGRLPDNCFAMVEQYVGRPEADVDAPEFEGNFDFDEHQADGGQGLTATAVRPQASFVLEADEERYARMADRVAIHHGLGHVLAIIEVVSPGNKSSRHALRTFAEKSADLIGQGVNLLVVDLFPPAARDPQGIHPLIWDKICEQPFTQATDAGCLSRRADQDGLRGTGGRGLSAARHAVVSPRPVAYQGTVGRIIRDRVERHAAADQATVRAKLRSGQQFLPRVGFQGGSPGKLRSTFPRDAVAGLLLAFLRPGRFNNRSDYGRHHEGEVADDEQS
jgi:hypothetical protein